MSKGINKYLKKYIMSEKTAAIIAVRTKDKKIISLVKEEDDEFFVLKKPHDIIDESCRYYGSSLEGRKEGTKYLTSFTNKLPICIDELTGLYFLPTSSGASEDCTWISHRHIQRIIEGPQNNVRVKLMNGQQLELSLSKKSLSNQEQRTALLRTALTDRRNRKLVFDFSYIQDFSELSGLAAEEDGDYSSH